MMPAGALDQRRRVPLELTVNADPDSIAIARIFAGTIARTVGLSEDRIEDVKIAVSEAVSSVVHHAADVGEQVRVRAIMRDDGPVFEVIGGPQPAQRLGVDPSYDPELGLTLVRALFPRTVSGPDPDGRHRTSIPVSASIGRVL